MLQKYNIQNNQLAIADQEETTVHIYSNPTVEERKYLIETLNLDQHSLSSALDPDEISRLELKPDFTFMMWTTAIIINKLGGWHKKKRKPIDT